MTVKASDFTEWKEFHIGAVISIITGRFITKGGIGDLYEILDWMTGDKLFTHQLPRASRMCEPILKDLYPELRNIEFPDMTLVPETDLAGEWLAWLDRQAEIHGEMIKIPKLLEYKHVDPISELVEMTGGKKPIIVIEVPESNGELNDSEGVQS